MIWITAVAVVAAYLLAFWYVYILVMGLYRAHLLGRLVGIPKLLAIPALVVGYAMDVFANIFIASVVFLEFPQEWLVTDRLTRHIKEADMTWRYYKALWVCTHLLDVFDPSGKHCYSAK